MLHRVKIILLLPLLLMQGLWVLIKTPRLQEAQGARKGYHDKGEPGLNLLILGDSAAVGVGVDQQSQALSGRIIRGLTPFLSVNWQLLGWSGCNTSQMLKKIQVMPETKVDVIVTSLGVNDVISTISASQWLTLQQDLIQLLKHKFSASLIIVTLVPPMEKFTALPWPLNYYLGRRVKEFNRLLTDYLASQDECRFLNIELDDSTGFMAEDGFHPGIKGYEHWGSEVSSVILNQYAAVDIKTIST